MKANTPELTKFKRLMRRLGESRRGVIGLLEGLWLAVAKDCPLGDVGRFDNEEIAIMCDWEHDPEDLVRALVDCGWLDECPRHRLVVHDWADHCPQYVKGNVRRYGKRFASTLVGTESDAGDDAPKEAPRDAPIGGSPGDTPSKPSQAKPNQAKPSQANAPRSSVDPMAAAFQPVLRLNGFLAAYPKEGQAKVAAIRGEYQRQVALLASDGVPAAEAEELIIQAAEAYTEARAGCQRPPHLPGAETWLREQIYRAPPEAWARDMVDRNGSARKSRDWAAEARSISPPQGG